MKPRDTRLRHDAEVWNSAREVDIAIHAYQARERTKRIATRWSLRMVVAAVVLVIVAGYGWWQLRSHAFFWNLNQLERQRTALAEQPFRTDNRVRELVASADKLESQARSARSHHRLSHGDGLLEESFVLLKQATELAVNLDRVSPLQQPLQAMLKNTNWNTECPVIRQQLEVLQQQYLEIKHEIASGEPEHAWREIAKVQQGLFELMENNRRSLEVAELFARFDYASVRIAPELAQAPRYRHISDSVNQARQTHDRGQWQEARTAILAQQHALRVFLDEHETDEQRANRVAASGDLLNEQIAAKQTLQADTTVQILFSHPEWMSVRWDPGGMGKFDSEPLAVPSRAAFPQDGVYRLKIANIEGLDGVELYPTIEIAAITPRTEAYLAHNAVPVGFTIEDFDHVLGGNFLTKVIYIPNPELQAPGTPSIATLSSTRLAEGGDPITEANRRGPILVVIRLGNKDFEMPDGALSIGNE